MDIYQINTGYMKMKNNFYLYPGLNNIKIYPCLTYLIKVNNRLILFDTGISDDIEEKIGVFKKFLTIETTSKLNLEKQLEKLNISCKDIDLVINSHLHFDHASNNKLFNSKKIIIQEKEYDDFKLNYKNPMYINESIKNIDSYIKIDSDYVISNGEYNVQLIRTYGHSAGHQSLLIENETDMIFILGDIGYLYNGKIKSIEVKEMKNYNESVNSINKVTDIINKTKKDVKILFSHDINISFSDGIVKEEIFEGIKKIIV